ncbi:hypothetical protein [Saccharopolyspora spinosa]|uniref:hypothetical protein n=1 Tax=Saccharopolyspora spinosa TaxID=60894 RepID=UPI00376EA1BB
MSLDEVVALVAAKHRELGGDQRDQVVEFSRALAERLGTEGSGLSIQDGAGPVGQVGRSEESAAELGSGHTSGASSRSGAAVPVDETASGAGDQRGTKRTRKEAEQRTWGRLARVPGGQAAEGGSNRC